MNQHATLEPHGVLTEPMTLTIQRLLPGPIERVWAFLTESELRAKWLAAGEMEMKLGSTFELIWRNDALTDPPGRRPDGMPTEHRRECTITELDPPRRLGFSWGVTDGVDIALEPAGDRVLLTLTHRRLPDRDTMLNVGAGWHVHLDLLAARMADETPEPFWDHWLRLKGEYDQRLPG